MKPANYRESLQSILGPILGYGNYLINNDGLLQPVVGNSCVRYDGKYLYVPKDGIDLFRSYGSLTLVPFNPFIKPEHTCILAKILCDAIGDKYRDEDDDPEDDIVTLAARGPKATDQLPSDFKGCIYEILCRKEDVLSVGVDLEGDHVRAILKTLINFLIVRAPQMYGPIADVNLFYDHLFREIARVEKLKSKGYEEAKAAATIALNDVELLGVSEETDSDEEEKETPFVPDLSELVTPDDDIFSDVDFL